MGAPAESWLPAVTAALVLTNTLVLVWHKRKADSTHELVNGMRLDLMHEAEQRGRRLERHKPRKSEIGK